MFIENFTGPSNKLTFFTAKKMDAVQAKEYATQKLQNERYKNRKIGKVFVNDELVLENVNIS